MTDADGNPEQLNANSGHSYHYQQQQLYQQQQQQQHAHGQYPIGQGLLQNLPRDDSFLKLKRLDEINASLIKIIQMLTNFFEELSKEKQPTTKLKQTKQLFEDFLKSFKKCETDLLVEITNLSLASTGHPHEGSLSQNNLKKKKRKEKFI